MKVAFKKVFVVLIFDAAGVFIDKIQRHLVVLLWQEPFNFLWPFNKNSDIVCKIVFQPNIQGFLQGLDTIKIKMVGHNSSLHIMVLIDQSESGAMANIYCPKMLKHGFDKGGFASAHLTVKTESLFSLIL